MNTVQPPVPAAPSAGTASQILATALVLQGAEALADLPPGTVLDGLVRNLGQRWQTAVQTPFGELTLRTNAALPEGARLTMQIGAASGQAMVRLTAIDGRPFAAAPPQRGQAATGQMQAAPGQTRPPADPGSRGPMGADRLQTADMIVTSGKPGTAPAAGIAATVLRSPSGALLPGQLPPGTGLVVRIAQVQPPIAGMQPQLPGQGAALPSGLPAQGGQPQAMPDPAAPFPAGPPGGAPAAAISQSAPSALSAAPPPGSNVPPPGMASGNGAPATPSAAAAPQAPIPAPSQALPPVVQGTVAASSQGGQTLVQTPLGMLSLTGGAAELPDGAAVTLELVGRPTPPPPGAGPAAAGLASLPLPTGPTGGSWQTLGQALTLLQRVDPKAAEELMRALPQIGPHLAAGLANAANAVRQGNRRGLIGDNALRALDRAGGKQSAARLEEEFEHEAAAVGKPAGGGEWRSMTLPMLDGAAIQEIRLSVRRPPPEEGGDGTGGDDGKREDGTRFLVDVTMSRLGPLQLDGLMRKGAKRFDLILRSKQPLDAEIRRDIAALFATSCEGMGMAGSVSFQATPTFIEVPRPAAESSLGGLGGGLFA